MEKILSVCIPSYNMEKYLSRNLDSFITSGCLDELELIVVNDGSKDRTLEIANEYKHRYPQTVVVVDKPNGHYGSCINAALKVATGKYFRIVDSDDWVDTHVLKSAINNMKSVEADCFYTHYTLVYDGTDRKELACRPDIQYDQVIELSKDTLCLDCLAMHSLSFKTELLHSINYTQTEGICYTDTEYVYYPIINSKTFYAMDASLYQYMIGRDGQTIDPKSLSKNYSHFSKIFKKIKDYDRNASQPQPIYPIIYKWSVVRLVSYMAYIAIILNHQDEDECNNLRTIVHDEIKNREIMKDLWSKKIHGFSYIKLWYKSIVGRLFLRLIVSF